MSYLSDLRLHFSGKFQANVSTVNNDAFHFNNAEFKPEYQQMEGDGMHPPNGWFNPEGDAAFRLLGCVVTSAQLPSGRVGTTDPVLNCIIADSDTAVPGKLVDLDPEQQLVSQIWGLTVRIADHNGNTLMRGEFEPSAFADIWSRALKAPKGSDTNAGACWQSVLTSLEWGDVAGSPFLSKLKSAATRSGMLSIKFNMDGINMDYHHDDFMCGRLVGTIGPQSVDEPRQLVVGRHFMSEGAPTTSFFRPAGLLNFCCGVVDQGPGRIFLDLGNALPTEIPGGPLANIGDLSLGYLAQGSSDVASAQQLGVIPASAYTKPEWYAMTAGVVVLPLTAAQRAQLADHSLVLFNTANHVITQESPTGAYVRADGFVYRLSPEDTADVTVHAMRFGQPLANTDIAFKLDTSQLQPTPDGWPFAGASPPVGEPTEAIPIPPSARTDARGVAHLRFTCGDPGKARWFNEGKDYGIDGQVYGVRPSFAEPKLAGGAVNEGDFVSFLIWSGWNAAHNPPTWHDVEPIFRQYANLYPVMSRFLDLGGYASVVENAELLQLAFSLPATDPNHMPVTRDLSPAKRAGILAFLANPSEGDPITDDSVHVGSPETAPDGPPSGAATAGYVRGGKAAAAARRLVLTQPEEVSP